MTDTTKESADIICELIKQRLPPKEAKEMINWLHEHIPDNADSVNLNVAESGNVLAIIVEVRK